MTRKYHIPAIFSPYSSDSLVGMKTNNVSAVKTAFAKPGIKALVVTGLVLAFLIPLILVQGLVDDRISMRNKAEESIIEPTGGKLYIFGPYLAVPYVRQDGYQTITGDMLVLAGKLVIESSITTETRTRGLFTAPVFTAELNMEGEILAAGVQSTVPFDAQLDWKNARLVIELRDLRSLYDSPSIQWNGSDIAFKSQAKSGEVYGRAIASTVKAAEGGRYSFSARLKVRGGRTIRFLEPAGEVRASLSGDWASPSFRGYVAPVERSVSDAGFSASWYLPESSQLMPVVFDAKDLAGRSAEETAFGLDLLDGVDGYDAAKRAVRYGILFIVVPFAALFLFELLTRSRVHPVQYALIGFANCLFYLLLLSLSEIIGFEWAYVLAASVCAALTGMYSAASLKSRKGLFLIPGLAILYGYLYSALRSEDYALLIGSLGLLALLAAAMYATRRIDWYGCRDASEGWS